MSLKGFLGRFYVCLGTEFDGGDVLSGCGAI